MDYSLIIRAVKDLVMKTPTSRLVLIWALVISCLLAWKSADILRAIAVLAK
jgi:hypothetical protein